MPLFEMSAAEAAETRKANPLASWGNRASTNRVEPIALPGFDAPVRLRRGDAIFTVGSCFARNVEVELMRLGFRVPMRELFQRADFAKLDPGIINNFGTPSIHNEFAWAFGEKTFVPEEHIVEVNPGKFADLHLVPSLRPIGWDEALARRRGITEAFGTLRECRMMVMTLGLAEVWFDTKTGYYLNATPRPGLVRAEPERFRLHVLSFDEAYGHLEASMQIVRRHCHPDLHVLMTVSPVPLAATHRPQDVLVANAYSKSLLRAVAETICARFDGVTYYPSYESVTLSDRHLAWLDDLVHPTDQIVALNVGRMVSAFVEDADRATLPELKETDVALAIEHARNFRKEGPAAAGPFFKRHAAFAATSLDFALEHAGFLLAEDRGEEALAVLDAAPPEDPAHRGALLRSEILSRLGRAAEAVAVLDPLATESTKSPAVWSALLTAATAQNDPALVLSVLARWLRVQPRRAGLAHTAVGRWRLRRGDVDLAIGHLDQALAEEPDAPAVRIYLAEALILAGQREQARVVITPVVPQSLTQEKLVQRLMNRLE